MYRRNREGFFGGLRNRFLNSMVEPLLGERGVMGMGYRRLTL